MASRMREAIASFGEREAEIEKDRRGRSYAEKRRFEEARKEEESQLAAAVAEVDARLEARVAVLGEQFTRRSERITIRACVPWKKRLR